jgi:hypothetical protein
MNRLYLSQPFVACYENNLDAFIPEQWAREGLEVLEENMVMANLVHRDFEPEIAKFGDVVNTRRPGEFKIRRKKDGTTLTQQDAVATNVQVPLDQWFYSSFVIRDGEGSKSFQELTDIYLRPAMQTIARGIDRALLGRVHAYLGAPAARVGKLGGLTASTAKDYVLDAREKLNIAKAPMDGRKLVMAPTSETAMLKTDLFVKANERGDGGTALQNATLGRILGFETLMDQNVNCVLSGSETDSDPVTEPYAAGTAAGTEIASVLAPTAGEFVVVAGNDQPTWATATNAAWFKLNEALKYATEDNAVATRYVKCVTAAAYATGYSEGVALTVTDGKAPQVGQLLAFGATTGTRHTYTVIESEGNGTSCTVYLDRPLVAAVGNGADAFPGPYGAMNLAFHRDALALVTRPLALPDTRAGVMVGNADYSGITMRVLAQYDINAGGLIVNCDILAGVAVLNSGLLVPVLG